MSIKFNSQLTRRIIEIEEKLEDPSLTEEEKKYYQQLKGSIWDTQTEELKEMRRKINEEGLVKFCKDNNYGIFGPPIKNPFPFDPKMVKFYKKLKKWDRHSSFRRL